MNLRPYIALARIDNWPKNLLMLAGVALASVMGGSALHINWMAVATVLASLCLASSANYVLNEAIDIKSDGCHPLKKSRQAVRHVLSRYVIAAEYLLLALGALYSAQTTNNGVVWVLWLYLACAWAYNIPPIRIKDLAYGDVLLESVNYPIRILLGWTSVLPQTLPPTSVLIIGWSVGAFVMSLKRLAEYQLFETLQQAANYRKSYAHYTIPTLLVCAFVYAMVTVFGITIFMLKYKTELLLLMPLVVAWMGWYLVMGYQKELCIIYPERLLGRPMFVLLVCATAALLALLLNVTIDWLHVINQPLEYR